MNNRGILNYSLLVDCFLQGLWESCLFFCSFVVVFFLLHRFPERCYLHNVFPLNKYLPFIFRPVLDRMVLCLKKKRIYYKRNKNIYSKKLFKLHLCYMKNTLTLCNLLLDSNLLLNYRFVCKEKITYVHFVCGTSFSFHTVPDFMYRRC